MTRVADRREPMSRRLWGLDWGAVLPWQLEEISVDHEPLEAVLPFIGRLYPETFNVDGRWLQEPASDARRRFGEEMDVFVFRTSERIVGVLAGHPTDWSTFYWRTAAFLPEYRGRHILTSFTDRLYAAFREAGVQRVEADTCPANAAMVKLLSGQGYLVTSTMTSERWGLMLRFTKFLDEEAGRAFERQFLDVPRGERSSP